MRGLTLWITLSGLALMVTGFLLLREDQDHRHLPRFDSTVLGPSAVTLQGPLAAGRTFLIPSSVSKLRRLMIQGRLGEAKKCALRLLTQAPWLMDIWLQVGWAIAFSPSLRRASPIEKARTLLEVEAWFSLASRVLPRESKPPSMAAFIITHLLPAGSPQAKEWAKLKGEPRHLSTLRWLKLAKERAPESSYLDAHLSSVAISWAGQAWAQGDHQACLSRLEQALKVEKDLLTKGIPSSGEWVPAIEKLMGISRIPFPGEDSTLKLIKDLAPGHLFLKGAGLGL